MINYRKIFWWALFIKTIQFVVFAFAFYKNQPSGKVYNFIFSESNDYGSYTLPSQNLVDHGAYYEVDRDGKKLYAHKMPGMVPIYAPLYMLLGTKGALTVLVVLEFLADVISVCLLAYIVQFIFSRTV